MKYIFIAGLAVAVVAAVVMSAVYLGGDSSTKVCITTRRLVRQRQHSKYFADDKQRHFTENWVYHLQQLGVGGLLVGMMSMTPSQPTYVALATQLRAQAT